MNWLGFRDIKRNKISYLDPTQEDKSITNYIKMISSKVGNLSKSWENSEEGMNHLLKVMKENHWRLQMDDIWIRLWRMKISLIGGKGREGTVDFPESILSSRLMPPYTNYAVLAC